MLTEPINLAEWFHPSPPSHKSRLFTCGRPGRAIQGKKRVKVDEEIIDSWVHGLPKAATLYIISLLGQKRDGYSEFEYYPFRSEKESGAKLTMQEWLDQRYPERFVIYEFPTVDAQGIDQGLLTEVANFVLNLLEGQNTVVIIDSAGAERTARVCEKMGYQK